MKQVFTILALLVTFGIVAASMAAENNSAMRRRRPLPREVLTLDEKVKKADLIVLGSAALFGEATVAGTNKFGVIYKRNIRIKTEEVLWPPEFASTSHIVFQSETDPQFVHTNALGVFFLITNPVPTQGRWEKLGDNGDWMEPPTNTLAVLLSITTQRGKINASNHLQAPQLVFPEPTRFDHKLQLRLAYLSEFRDGYTEALAGRHGIRIFAPATEEDKAKVLGFADGQLAGDTARLRWFHKFDLLMSGLENRDKK